MMERMWIDQPSSHQPLHKEHGKNVLVDTSKEPMWPTIYYLSGDIVSARVSIMCLSRGWRS